MSGRSAEEIRGLVGEIVRSLAPTPVTGPIHDRHLVDDLGYHSLALLELAFALEDEFGLPPMREDQAQRIRTVSEVEDYVARALTRSVP
jgi:acyl carrier protein